MAEKKTTVKKATAEKKTATKKAEEKKPAAKATAKKEPAKKIAVEAKPASDHKSTKATKQAYNDQSIKALKGADRVRKRPGVIFGSDGLEGCEHSFFEILSNSVDEAREGHGNVIKVTAYRDHSIEVDDHGRGVPL